MKYGEGQVECATHPKVTVMSLSKIQVQLYPCAAGAPVCLGAYTPCAVVSDVVRDGLGRATSILATALLTPIHLRLARPHNVACLAAPRVEPIAATLPNERSVLAPRTNGECATQLQ